MIVAAVLAGALKAWLLSRTLQPALRTHAVLMRLQSDNYGRFDDWRIRLRRCSPMGTAVGSRSEWALSAKPKRPHKEKQVCCKETAENVMSADSSGASQRTASTAG